MLRCQNESVVANVQNKESELKESEKVMDWQLEGEGKDTTRTIQYPV